jgi:hypothetical protein
VSFAETGYAAKARTGATALRIVPILNQNASRKAKGWAASAKIRAKNAAPD